MEDRNFRTAFYDKMNIRSVDEKKNLEIILKESPVNKLNLMNFLKKFSVPAIHRSLLYNLALNVYPIYKDSTEFVMEQKKETYHDLHRALETMKYIDDKTPTSKVFFAMFLLESRQLTNFASMQRESSFPLIAEVIHQSLDDIDEVEAYFITKNFYKFSFEEITRELPKLKLLTYQMLEKEEHDLYENLKSKNILEELPFNRWYPSIFSSILNELSLIRIFDRIAGGSHQIVVFIFIAICSYTKNNLKTQINALNVTKIIENYPGDDSEKSNDIVNKTINLWHKFSNVKSTK